MADEAINVDNPWVVVMVTGVPPDISSSIVAAPSKAL